MRVKKFCHKILWIVGMLVMGTCLIRIFSVAASGSMQSDIEEVYTNETEADDENTAELSNSDVLEKTEIRFSRPEEAQNRIAYDKKHDLVPGAEILEEEPKEAAHKVANKEIANASRKIASLDTSPATTPMEPPHKPVETPHAQAQDTVPVRIWGNTSHLQKKDLGRKPLTKIETPIPQPTLRSTLQEISVIVSDQGFYPERIVLTQGTPVKMYLITPAKVPLCFMVDEWGIRKGVKPGKIEEISFTPDQPGNFRFYCPVKSIEGKITVRELPVVEFTRATTD